VLIVASALLGVMGWQSMPPVPVPPTTIMITPAVTTVSASQTTVIPSRSTEWITIGQVRPVDYYLSLLESNGTQPYVQLARELRKLPDLANATAVAKITYLALNATNLEVKEAFELTMKGGTPDPADFKYAVPDYNTELQVLYWLACQNEFKKDDTLALAIAMTYGLWITMGDMQVKEAVKRNVSDLLSYFREINEIQKLRGARALENYPLEAKICLSWTGGQSATMAKHHALNLFKRDRLDFKSYLWSTVSIETLKGMRSVWDKRGWADINVDKAVSNVEQYFYCGELSCKNWIYTVDLTKVPSVGGKIEIDGEEVGDYIFGNVNSQFQYFLETGKGFGVSVDQANLVDAFARSFGISSTITWQVLSENPNRPMNHPFMLYYEPVSRLWKAWPLQAKESHKARQLGEKVNYLVLKPPVFQQGYVPDIKHNVEGPRFEHSIYVVGNPYLLIERQTTVDRMSQVLIDGVATPKMKQWLLYS